jgi:Uri superfamily endonuclease
VDYLRRMARVETAWWAVADSPAAEDACARAMEALPGLAPSVPGFGAGDSPRVTHLFFGHRVPGRRAFEGQLRGAGFTGQAVRGIDGARVGTP